MTFVLHVYEDNDLNGTQVGQIDLTQSAISARFTDVLHGAGSMELILPRHHTDAALLQRDRGVRLETDAGTVGLWFLEEGKIDLSSADEKGGEFLKWEGRGSLAILERGVMDNDSNIAGGKDPIDLFWDLSAQGDFAGASNGHPIPMMKRALVEVALNPPNAIALVDHSGFDYDLDSDGADVPFWDGVFGADVGESLYNLAARFDQLGGFIQRMSDTFVYDMYLAYGDDKSGAFGAGTVRFEKGINVAVALQRKLNPNVTRTHLVVRGAANAFLTVANPSYSAGDVIRWGSLSVNETDGLGAMEEAALNNFAARERASDAYVLPMPAHGDDPVNGIYEPNDHFKVGDLVTAHTGSGTHDLNAVSVPVAAITWRTKDGTDYVYDVELGYNYHWTEGPEAQFSEAVGCTCPRGAPVCAVGGGPVVIYDNTSGLWAGNYPTTSSHCGANFHDFGGSGATSGPFVVSATTSYTLVLLIDANRHAYTVTVQYYNGGAFISQETFPLGVLGTDNGVECVTRNISLTTPASTTNLRVQHAAKLGGWKYQAHLDSVATSPDNDPYCVTDGGQAPYFMRVDDPRLATLENAVEEINQGGTVSWKQPVRVATTTAGTLASSFEEGDTIDGVVLVAGDRILIKDQAAGAENGIYFVNETGAPTRSFDMDASDEVLGGGVLVSEGTANADTVFLLTTNAPITLGTTALVFAEMVGGGVTDHGALTGLGDDDHPQYADDAHAHDPPTPGVHKILVKRTTNFSATNSNDSVPDYSSVVEDTMTDSWWDAGDPDGFLVTADYDGLDAIFMAKGAASDLNTSEYLEAKMYYFPAASGRNRPIHASTDEDYLIAVEQQPAVDNVNHFIHVQSDPITVGTGDRIFVAWKTETAQTVIPYNGRVSVTLGAYIIASPGEQGDPGEGVPVGGTAGQVLTKDSGTDFDTSWQPAGTPDAHAASHQNGGADEIDVTGLTGAGSTNLQAARFVRSTADYTTSSTTFADVDGTNFALTITTGARRVMIGLVGSAYLNNTAGTFAFDVTVDATRQGGDFGLQAIHQHATASEAYNVSFVYLTDVLSAASHTFKLQWRVSSGAHTATLMGNATGGANCEFWVAEIYAG